MMIIGHRGASGRIPEHSARAMRAALEHGAGGIECDVRLTADGHLVCFHDADVRRTCDEHSTERQASDHHVSGMTVHTAAASAATASSAAASSADEVGAAAKAATSDLSSWRRLPVKRPRIPRPRMLRGRISTMTLAQLQAKTFHGEPLLTFTALLDLWERYPGTHLFIETKHPQRFGGKVEEHLVAELRRRGLIDSPYVHVISFHITALERIRRAAPQLHTIWLHRDYLWPLSALLMRVCRHDYGAKIDLLRAHPGLLAKITGPAYCYTANTDEQIAAAARLGIKYVATDFPARAQQVRSAVSSASSQ